MQTATLAEKESIQASGGRVGNVKLTYLAKGKPGPNNYAAFITDTESWVTPRHKHTFDQMKICLRGGTNYAGIETPAGSVVYIGESVPYGPQKREPGTLQFTVQFGGASGMGYVSGDERRAAMAELKKTGEFKDGAYTWVDEDGKRHNQDSFEVCVEHVLGRKLVYPKPRYNEMIVMNPDHYEWGKPDANGVSLKWLASFSERGTRVGMVRLDAGATWNAGLHKAPEVLLVTKGSVKRGDTAHPLHTAFGLEAMEGPIAIHADEPAELWYLQMPVHDD
jgi:hypothetical protein